MRIIDPGHLYELESFEGDLLSDQELRFFNKEPILPGSVELETTYDGTTNEEVLKVLINRLQYLNTKFPCRENAISITKLEEALMWQEKRTADRRARVVEGTNQK